jgi:hypothetical protein
MAHPPGKRMRQGRDGPAAHLEPVWAESSFVPQNATVFGGPSDGGAATVQNIELRCRAHNQYEAALLLGAAADSSGNH